MSHYKAVSEQIFDIFREFTPLVEGLSLDEAFLDVSDSLTIFGNEELIAAQIKQRIKDVTKLTASVGVAPNKLVAKIASDLDKPDGLVVVSAENTITTLDPLPVQVIPGIGRETLAKLRRKNIATIADLRLATNQALKEVFGRFAQLTRERASGIDNRPVIASRADKSISAEETFEQDLHTIADLHRELLRLTERTTQRLRTKQLAAGTLQVKIRRADFTTFTRQRTLHPPSNNLDTLYEVARDLLSEWLADHPGARVRLLGVGGSALGGSNQLDLFTPATESGGSKIDQTVDDIRQRFGNKSVSRARSLNPDQIR
jgi:nucleotidyltransferase/DNA polymerase involved in DNA repair